VINADFSKLQKETDLIQNSVDYAQYISKLGKPIRMIFLYAQSDTTEDFICKSLSPISSSRDRHRERKKEQGKPTQGLGQGSAIATCYVRKVFAGEYLFKLFRWIPGC
jgi:hypothetical protein